MHGVRVRTTRGHNRALSESWWRLCVLAIFVKVDVNLCSNPLGFNVGNMDLPLGDLCLGYDGMENLQVLVPPPWMRPPPPLSNGGHNRHA